MTSQTELVTTAGAMAQGTAAGTRIQTSSIAARSPPYARASFVLWCPTCIILVKSGCKTHCADRARRTSTLYPLHTLQSPPNSQEQATEAQRDASSTNTLLVKFAIPNSLLLVNGAAHDLQRWTSTRRSASPPRAQVRQNGWWHHRLGCPTLHSNG